MMYILKDNIINLEKRLEEIKEDIKYINVSVDDYKSAGFNERVQTSLKAGSTLDRKSTRLNSSHSRKSRMPSSA